MEVAAINVSHKMRVLSVSAFLGVMLIHSAAPLHVPDPAKWNYAFARILCEHMAHYAVPFFFFGSGYWFGRGKYIQMPVGGGYWGLLKTKFRTLFVPYVFWSLIGAAVGIPLLLVNNHIQHNPILARTFLEPADWLNRLGLLFGVTYFGPIHCGVMWYVKHLMFCFLIGFIFKWIVQKRYGAGLLLSLSLVGILIVSFSVPGFGIASSSLGYFAAGVAVARFGWLERRMPAWMMALGLVYWIGVSSWMGIADAYGWAYPHCVGRLVPIAGIIGTIGFYDNSQWLQNTKLHPLALETFWLYCSHQIIASYLIAAAFFALGKGNAVSFGLVFATPLFAIIVSLALAVAVKRYAPKAFAVLTGGRG